MDVARLPLPAYVWQEGEDGTLQLLACNEEGATVEPAIREMFGLTIDELSETAPAIAAHLQKAFDEQTVVTAVEDYRRRDGEVRRLRLTFVFAPPGRVLIHVDDITDRDERERALRTSNRRLRDAFERSPIGKAVVAADGTVAEANESLCRLLETPREELVGAPLPPSIAEPGDARRIARRDGPELTVAVATSPLEQEDGSPPLLLCQVADVTERRRAEQALRASEERYRHIVETTSEGVWVIDAEERTTFVNARMAEMLGYQAGEMIGRPLGDFVFDPAPAIHRKLEERPPGASEPHETRLRRRDGTTLWVSLSSDSLRGDDGSYRGALAMVRDVTARRRELSELHEAKVRFEGAFAHAPIGMAIVSIEAGDAGRLVQVNRALCDLLGYSADTLVGTSAAEFTHPDDIKPTARMVRDVLAGRKPTFQLEKRYITKAGDVVLAHVSASIVSDPEGTPLYGIAHIQDVTEARRAADELEQRERHFRTVFELAGDAMVVADDDRRWVEVNAATGTLLAEDPADLVGRRIEEFSAPDPERVDEAWEQFLALGEMAGVYDLLRADGEVRHVEFNARANVVPGRHLSILRDVTERKRAEEAREQARREAARLEDVVQQAQRLESVGQLAGGVAHDFNNLLAIILNSADFALAELGDHPAAEDVRAVHSAAERAAALTRQLLVFSRREIATAELVDVNELVGGIQRLLARTLGENLVVHMDLDDAVPCVEADPGHLEQVLLNLAVNARDAMPGGGTLTFATAGVELGEREARLYGGIAPGRYVRLTVSDTGVGMSPAVRDRALEPFFTTKPKGSGTGLGLATAYGIVKQNGGHIELESEPGRGTVVVVLLPATDEAAPAPAASTGPASHARGEGRRVLLVEDEHDVRAITERILEQAGYTVLPASGPDAAVGIAELHDVDLVVTDVVMPGRPGTEVAQEIRRFRPDAKVLFMSGYTDRPDALPAGGHFIGKPFSRQALLAAVDEALRS